MEEHELSRLHDDGNPHHDDEDEDDEMDDTDIYPVIAYGFDYDNYNYHDYNE